MVAVALLGIATACSNNPDSAEDADVQSSAEPTQENTESPRRGISVGIYQLRQGYGSREFQVKVTNDTDKLMRVDRAAYVSTRFAKPAVWSDGTRIPGGLTIDLPVQLKRTRCDPDTTTDKVVLEFRQGNSGLQRKTYEPELLYDSVQRFIASDCASRDIAKIAAIRVGDDIEIHGDGRKSVAHLPLIIEPTGEQGSFTLDSILSTTLIGPTNGGDSWDLGIDVDGSGDPQRKTLKIDATRCDSHALSDNSQGTEFTATFTLAGGQTTQLVLGTSSHLEGRLTSWVAASCGYGPDVD